MTILEHFEFLKLVLIKVGHILAGTRLPFFHLATPVHLVLYDKSSNFSLNELRISHKFDKCS